MRASKTKFVAICKCGHDHVQEVGDDNAWRCYRYEILTSCCYCDCENYQKLTAKKTKLAKIISTEVVI